MTLPHDVAVVLGAPGEPDGRISPVLSRRVGHAVALYRAGVVGHLLLSGGAVRHAPAEAVLMREAAFAAGVPRAAVLTEERSRNTLENAGFCREIIVKRGWRRILIVTDGYHLPRALYTFRRLGMAASGAAAPLPPVDAGLLAAHAREVAAFLCYLWRVERQVARENR